MLALALLAISALLPLAAPQPDPAARLLEHAPAGGPGG
jgi:hypothetical protein